MSGTGQLISETGIVPKKSKGQNFLTDGRVADRHISYADIQRTDRVLEVGPGLGILTERLLEKTDDLTCIELDDILADYISKTYGDRLKLIHGDAVKVPFPEFDVFVSNLPYSVSTPIIFKLLDYSFRTAVVMVQKEFADRMVADVGSPDYSRLTVGLFYRADCEIMETVPASRFNPKPKVDSALVRITPRKAPFDVIDEDMFFKVTKVAFDHRRKKIGTSLKAAGLVGPGMDVPYLDDRIEHLRPSEIAEIADAISRSGNRGVGETKDHLARRYCIFFAGLITITFGISIITKANLGTSPITSIPYSLSLIFDGISFGTFTLMFSILQVILQFVILGKDADKFNLMLQFVICFVFGYFVDFAMMVMSWFEPTEYIARVLSVVAGCFVLAFGVYLQLVADVVMVPGDGFVYALKMKLRWEYAKVRFTHDLTLVAIAAAICLVCLGNLGGVREGTLISVACVGLIARQYLNRLGRLTRFLLPPEPVRRGCRGILHP